jgi:hypothetical protein
VLLNLLAQRSVDARLMPLVGRRVALEPSHDICIEPQGKLLLDRPIEQAALDTGQVNELGRI